eukprot:1772750-Ditylum_brightwellii.AAC.1
MDLKVVHRIPIKHNLEYWQAQSTTQMKEWLQCNVPYVKYCLSVAYQKSVHNHQDIHIHILGKESYKALPMRMRATTQKKQNHQGQRIEQIRTKAISTFFRQKCQHRAENH